MPSTPVNTQPLARVLLRTAALTVALVAAGAVGAATRLAAGLPWTSHGPQAGEVFTVAVAPSNASLFYVGTRDGVLRTTDGGQSWSRFAFPGMSADVFADPHDASRLFVSTFEGDLYRLSDAGATFARVASGAAQLAVDPTNAQVILVARNNSGLLRSGDGGATWTAVGPPDVVFRAVAIRGQLALAGVYVGGGGLYRSTDAGFSRTIEVRADGRIGG
jgi:photosystem II stability/assembly factor-like uncharacterized protein